MIKRSRIVRLSHYGSGSGSKGPLNSSWSSMESIAEARHGIKSRSGACAWLGSYSGPHLDISYSGFGPCRAFPYFRSRLTREVMDMRTASIATLFNM